MKKPILLLIISTLYAHSIVAQHGPWGKQPAVEWGANVGGGIASFQVTDPDLNASKEGGIWADVFLDYHLVNKNWSVMVGVGIVNYNTTLTMGAYSGTYAGVDNDGAYEFNTTASNLEEEFTALCLQSPIALKYKHPIKKTKMLLLATLGLKFSYPIQTHYKLNKGTISTRLYYPEWNAEIYDVPEWGLYEERDQWHPEGEVNMLLDVAIFTNCGFIFRLNDHLCLSTALNVSYGLRDVITTNDVLMHKPQEYNSMISMANKARALQLGASMGIIVGRDRFARQW